MPDTLRTAKQQHAQAYEQGCAANNLSKMVKAWADMVDTLWAEWEDCTQLDDWINELDRLRQLIEEQQQPHLLPYLAKGAFAALSIRQMDHPDFAFWEQINLQSLEREHSVEERLLRSLQCMIHYTWGIGDQPRSSLVLDYLNIILRQDNSSGMVQCIQPVCAAAYQYWFEPNHQACLDTIDKGLARSKKLGLSMWDVPMLNVALFQTCSNEQPGTARHYLHQLSQRLDEHSRPHDFAIYYHFKAYLAWLDGRHSEALFAAEKALDIASQTGFSFSPLYYRLAVAQILASLGQYSQALRHISHCRKTARRYGSNNIEYMSLICGASITLNAGREWIARYYLRRAAHLDTAHHYQRIPWLRLHDIARLNHLHKGALNVRTTNRHKCHIYSLGKLRISSDHHNEATSRKLPRVPLTLLLHFIAAGENGISRETVVEYIWPEADAEKGSTRLKTTLRRLRRLLGSDTAITQRQGNLSLNPEECQIDSWAFERLYQEALAGNMESAAAALALYQGSFDHSLTPSTPLHSYRNRLEHHYTELVSLLTKHYLAQSDTNAALAVYQQALALDPVNEDFCTNLIKLLRDQGRTTELRKVIAQCRANWQRELSIDLPEALLALQREAQNDAIHRA